LWRNVAPDTANFSSSYLNFLFAIEVLMLQL
jgi:hypothetical protein